MQLPRACWCIERFDFAQNDILLGVSISWRVAPDSALSVAVPRRVLCDKGFPVVDLPSRPSAADPSWSSRGLVVGQAHRGRAWALLALTDRSNHSVIVFAPRCGEPSRLLGPYSSKTNVSATFGRGSSPKVIARIKPGWWCSR